jgi:hypothetical protein
MHAAGKKGMTHTVVVSPEFVEKFRGIIRSADELRILAGLVHIAVGSGERRPFQSPSYRMFFDIASESIMSSHESL